MIIISSREFRQNQAEYFERVDNGEQVVVQRGKNKAYALTPIKDGDIYLNSAMLEKIKKSISEIEEGEFKSVGTSKEIADLLNL